MKGCDVLLIAGSNFPYLEFYPKPGAAKIVQIDTDSSRIGLRCPVDVGLTGDCGRILRGLLPMVESKTDRGFLQQAQKGMAEWRRLLEVQGTRADRPMKPQVVAHAVNKFLADDAIVTTDCGTVTAWAARFIRIRDKMQFSSSGILATMANGLPYSIGAAVAYPGRQVVCLAGDGGFTMLMGELATLVKYKLPVKIIVFKNNSLGNIKWEQMALEGNPEFGCDLQPVDFAAAARAFGVAGFTLEDPAQADAVLAEAFAHPGPALVDAVIDPNEPVVPGHVTMTQAVRFAEALVRGQKDGWEIFKTVLEDRVREVV
jgi:pyruvate dehydrogenase (quinone)